MNDLSKTQVADEVEERAEPTTISSVTGYIDGFFDGALSGWAIDDADPEATVELMILVDGEAVGEATADHSRPDLRGAGLPSVEHGFEIRLPMRVLDGQEHTVEVIEVHSRLHISNSPRQMTFGRISSGVTGEITGLEWTWLLGWVRDAERLGQAIEFRLKEGGVKIAEGFADQPRGDGSMGFAVRLPDSVCDGAAHLFEIETDQPVGALALVTPFLSTPPELLAEFADAALRGRLANSAAYRYQALQEQLDRLGRRLGKATGTTARDLSLAHSFLVDGPRRKGQKTIYEPISFPKVDAPVASVLVPVHNKFHYTYHCLASLLLMPNDIPFEVLILDDGSTDETAGMESIVENVRVIRHKSPLGFLRNCNAGAKEARGKYVVLLNNDTEVTPHWLDRLIRPFERFADVGLTGAKLIFGNGRLQEAGGLVWRDGNAWNYGRNGNPRDPRYNYLRDTDYCSGACIALEKSFWDQLGGFDEEFAPAYYEDTDLAFRVRAAGKRVVYQPMSEVIHFEGVSSGTDLSAGIKRYQAVNKPKFLGRWSQQFRGNGMPGDNPDFNKERSYSRRVLVIDHEVPQPDRSAGHYAAMQEIRLLQSLGLKPTFLPQNMAHLGRYNDELAEMGVETVYSPFAVTPEEFLSKRGHEFDLVYITRYYVARDMLNSIRHYCPQAKVILNNADLHFLRMLRSALAERSDDLLAEVCKVRDEELDVMRRVDLTLSYNETEHAVILSHNLSSTKVSKCPWVIEPRSDIKSYASRQDIAFLGGFRHPPNLEAVRFFVRSVMPLVREELPGVKFRIYGSYPPTELFELESEDVIVEGFVDEIDEVFQNCRVFVAPLLTGAGIKGKVFDALAFGVPTVMSPIAAEGIGLRDGLEAAIASEPQAFAAAVKRFYLNEKTWKATSAAAQAFVKEHHSFESGRRALEQALMRVDIPATPGPYPLW